jgi:phosphopantetheine adenylyltransferase
LGRPSQGLWHEYNRKITKKEKIIMRDYDDFEDEEKLDLLEEQIKENVEWLYTTDNDEIECISVENLEGILSKFFGRKMDLKQ